MLPADRIGPALAEAASKVGERAVVALLGLVDGDLADDPDVVKAVAHAALAFSHH